MIREALRSNEPANREVRTREVRGGCLLLKPNPALERTVNGGAARRCSSTWAAPLSAAQLQRWASNMSSHLVYHPRRCVAKFGRKSVHFDAPRGNQDPYIWSTRFLHTYCHMTELQAPVKGDINFWVSGDRFPKFHHLFCDLVFVVDHVHHWPEANYVAANDPLVESAEAYADHYMWAAYQHRFRRKTRRTLKAHPRKSFQPQDGSGGLVDIIPFLKSLGWSVRRLRVALQKGRGSKPISLTAHDADALYMVIENTSLTKLRGSQLRAIRQRSPQLASPEPKQS